MSEVSQFIANDSLPDIEYRTDAPEEIVTPRVVVRNGTPCVYMHGERHAEHKGHVSVHEFLTRLSMGERGLAVTGYRANKKQTTISFNKSDRVSLSPKLQSYLESLNGKPQLDAQGQDFLAGFLEEGNPQFVRWLPGYINTLREVQAAIEDGAPEVAFDLIWKTRDNSVSNAGLGVLGFDAAESMREPLTQMIGEIARDGSPAQFHALLTRMKAWRDKGALPKVPQLLLARAFATIHPSRYHTTVDHAKQERVIPWFQQHTCFVPVQGDWATQAEALTAHLERAGVFGGDRERRNIFPWFVFEQVRDGKGQLSFRPGHTSKASHGSFTVSEGTRNVTFRHNSIQDLLVDRLRREFGDDSVASEHATGTGGRADVLVKRSDGRFDLYEIKPASSASQAVREALGQLLEYGYRQGGLDPTSLNIVSDATLDHVTQEYLEVLKDRFGLEFRYIHFDLSEGA